MIPRIYLDNAATTLLRPDVLEAMLPYLSLYDYNAGSVHAEGRAARAALDDARERVARCLHAQAKEIVFTGGGSEADNLALIGVARALRDRGRHIVTTAIEHHAVLHTVDALRDEGFEVTIVGVDSDGRLNPAAFAQALRPDTVLASVMYVNNEIGTIAPIAQLCEVAHAKGVLFHTDAVQAAAYLPIDVERAGVDLLSIAAHKFGGPKGAGALYVREGTPIQPILRGGSQEFSKRAGTENVGGIIGLCVALEVAISEQEAAAARLSVLRDRFERELCKRVKDVRINASHAPRAPHICNASFLGVGSVQLLMRLDLDGIAVSTGSACTSGVIEPSHVIAALGLPEPWTRGVIRFSLGRTTSGAEIDRALEALERDVPQLRAVCEVPL